MALSQRSVMSAEVGMDIIHFHFRRSPRTCVCVCGETETDRQTKGREREMGERERERGSRGTYFKELAYEIMEAGKSKICRVGQQARELGRAHVSVQVQRPPTGRIPSCSGEVSLLF